MKLNTEHKPFFVAVASNYSWGRGYSIADAVKETDVTRAGKVKKGVKLIVWRIDNWWKHQLSERDLNPMHNGGITFEDYKPGDSMMPFVDGYGAAHYYGNARRITLEPGQAIPAEITPQCFEVGDMVEVYQKPVTREEYEGDARLVYRVHADYGGGMEEHGPRTLERWSIQFLTGDTNPVERWICLNDKSAR